MKRAFSLLFSVACCVSLMHGCSNPAAPPDDGKVKVELQESGFAKNGYESHDWSSTNMLFAAYSAQVPVGFRVQRTGDGLNISSGDDKQAALHIRFYGSDDTVPAIDKVVQSRTGATLISQDPAQEVKGSEYTFQKMTFMEDPHLGYSYPPSWNKHFVMVSAAPRVVANSVNGRPVAPELLSEYEKIVLSLRMHSPAGSTGDSAGNN